MKDIAVIMGLPAVSWKSDVAAARRALQGNSSLARATSLAQAMLTMSKARLAITAEDGRH